jgi:hypothetical protein
MPRICEELGTVAELVCNTKDKTNASSFSQTRILGHCSQMRLRLMGAGMLDWEGVMVDQFQIQRVGSLSTLTFKSGPELLAPDNF